MASLILFSCKKARQTKSFCLRMVKNRQHQHKGKPHTHEKIQGTAISRAVAKIIFKGVNLSGAHCNP
jgi:penicillin-binding protein-related factor A (putative recombinase)